MKKGIIQHLLVVALIILVWVALYYVAHFGNSMTQPTNETQYKNTVQQVKETEKDEIPTCKHTPLVEMKPIVMDDVVKQCTIKKKIGKSVEWLWWGMTDYQIFNWELMDDFSTSSIECEDKDWISMKGGETIYGVTSNEDGYFIWIEAVKRIVKKWYLYSINQGHIPYHFYCSESNNGEFDSDCLQMSNRMWWLSWTNYFVAGYRDLDQNKLYYVINDKLYDPGNDDLVDVDWWWDYIKESSWLFSHIENNYIVVKKIKDWQLNSTKNNNLDSDKMPTTRYTLETCKINLD